VLDAFCVRCHNEPDPPPAERFGDRPWKPDLRGGARIADWHTKMAGQGPKEMAGKFSVSYANLHRYVRRPGIESDIHLFVPMEWHADTTELLLLLQKGHHGVRLSEEALDRLVTWIDYNAPYHGRWQTIVDAATAVAKRASAGDAPRATRAVGKPRALEFRRPAAGARAVPRSAGSGRTRLRGCRSTLPGSRRSRRAFDLGAACGSSWWPCRAARF
jgi:hypothetical protein